MYLFVYKTIHKNGRYYIGRHQTDNLDDGYLGSGKWVKGIKNKSTLSREIISEAKSIEELYKLEEYYIDLHWDDPLCMNYTKGSKGFTSSEVREMNLNRSDNGTNPFKTRPDGTSMASDQVENGTHPWQKREDGTSLAQDRVINGTNPFMTRSDGTSLAQDKVKKGTHHFLTRPDGTNLAIDRVNNGTHHWLKNTGLVPCRNKQGEFKKVPKDQYHSQKGLTEDWEWGCITSKEGKGRKLNNIS